MKRINLIFKSFLFSLVIFIYLGTIVADESSLKSQSNDTKLSTKILDDSVITHDIEFSFYPSNQIQSRDTCPQVVISNKESGCTLVSSKPPVNDKNKLFCYSLTDLFTSVPKSIKLEVYECSSLNRKNCRKVYFLIEGKDYFFEEDNICISDDRKSVCVDNRDKHGSNGNCIRFYDISVNSPSQCSNVKTSIIVANKKDAVKNLECNGLLSTPPPPPIVLPGTPDKIALVDQGSYPYSWSSSNSPVGYEFEVAEKDIAVTEIGYLCWYDSGGLGYVDIWSTSTKTKVLSTTINMPICPTEIKLEVLFFKLNTPVKLKAGEKYRIVSTSSELYYTYQNNESYKLNDDLKKSKPKDGVKGSDRNVYPDSENSHNYVFNSVNFKYQVYN